MAHAFVYLYNIKATGLRFFTVYGPYGRPDMALLNLQKIFMKISQLMSLIMAIMLEILLMLMI